MIDDRVYIDGRKKGLLILAPADSWAGTRECLLLIDLGHMCTLAIFVVIKQH